MRVLLRRGLIASSLLVIACGDKSKNDTDAAAAADTSADSGNDTLISNDSDDDTLNTDEVSPNDVTPDTAEPDSTPDDSTPDDTTSADTVAPGDVVAVHGARCAPGEMVARIEVETFGGATPTSYLNAWASDRPNPAIGAPELTSGDCVFHRQPSGCGICGENETCGVGSVCATIPASENNISIVATGDNSATQTFSPDQWGSISEQLTIPGASFGLAVTFRGATIDLAPMAVPGDLASTSGQLGGDYMDPTSLRADWIGGEAGARVFTHININHHVRAQTFTQCDAPSDGGSFEIGADMLKPLAVSTGLEFQGLEHVRFAAADTIRGCVEFRFLRRQWMELNTTPEL